MSSATGLAAMKEAARQQTEQVTFLTMPGLYVVFIGTGTANAASHIAVATNGDITFYRGATAAAITVDTSIGTSGVIDVSVAATNTFGEVADLINASLRWRCHLGAVLRATTIDDGLATLTRTAGTFTIPDDGRTGWRLVCEVDTLDYLGFCIQTIIMPDRLVNTPHSQWGRRAELNSIPYATWTYTGTGTLSVVAEDNAGTTRTLGVTGPAPASTVDFTWDPDGGDVATNVHERLLFRLTAATAISAGTVNYSGKSYPMAFSQSQ